MVAVFAVDPTRGSILARSLEQGGMKPRLFNDIHELKKSLTRHLPVILVFDTICYPSLDLDLIKRLHHGFANVSLLVIGPPPLLESLKNTSIGHYRLIEDPFDPDEVVFKVKELNFIKNRGYWRISLYAGIIWGIVKGKKGNPYIELLQNVFFALLVILSVVVGLAGGLLYWSLSDLPKVEVLEQYYPLETSYFYSADKELLAEIYLERRTFLPYYKIPRVVKNAFIAVEDARFYSHHGIDFVRTFGALAENYKSGLLKQGGSTITQQLAKMVFLKPERTLARKIKEAILSIQIERHYTKDEILGLYLNQAYFGARAYGIEAAASTYFGKKTEDLTLPEVALLAALPKAPEKFSPFKEPALTFERRNLVLKRMLVNGFIDEENYRAAIREPLPEPKVKYQYKAPYFVDYVRAEVEKELGNKLYTGGLKITTTLDMGLQKIAEESTAYWLKHLEDNGISGVQAALLAVDMRTGSILAMVGGDDFRHSQFNRATQALRQPGSTFKPFVYLTGLENGYTPESVLVDREIPYGREGWTPKNYSRTYLGTVTAREALTRSLNAATVYLANKVGIRRVIATARNLGIRSSLAPYLPTALGASDVTLLDLTYAYGAMATGMKPTPRYFHQITGRNNMIIAEPSQSSTRVIPEKQVEQMRGLLRNVVLHGTARAALVLDRPVYGKTGTTNDYTDAWFVGFDDRLAVGVWIGRDNHKSIGEGTTGGKTALPLWIEFMRRAGKERI